MISGIRHTDLCVTDLELSRAFYCSLLGFLGWNTEPPYHEIVGEQGERVLYLPSPDGFHAGALGLRASRSLAKAHRYYVGMHHIAFNAPTRSAVDDVAEWAKKTGVEFESGPEEYYDVPYYALFLHDPDKIKVEIVHYIPEIAS